MLVNTAPIRLISTATCLSLAMITIGYNQSACAKEGWVIAERPTVRSNGLRIPALQKEMSYAQSRQLIIDAGWQPLVTTTDNPEDGTQSWRDRGYNEVSSCSGTGMGFCRFEFTGSGSQKLVVVTGGRNSTLKRWWKETDKRD
jgi:hypothetical protein